MKSRHYLSLLLGICFLPCSIQAASGLENGLLIARRGDSNEGRRPSMFSRIALSDEQLEQLVDRKTKYETQVTEDQAKIRLDYRKMFNLLTKPEANRKEAMAIHTRIMDRKERMSKARLSFFLDAWDMLNDDQKKDMRRKVLEHQLNNHSWSGRGQNSSGGDRGPSASTASQDKSSSASRGDNKTASPPTASAPTAEQFLMMLAAQED